MLRNIILRIHLSRLTKRPPVGGFVIVVDLASRNNRVELLLQHECNVVQRCQYPKNSVAYVSLVGVVVHDYNVTVGCCDHTTIGRMIWYYCLCICVALI